MPTSAPNIFIRNAFLVYQEQTLFNHLDLTLTAGKWTCLLGPSGVGKTSLLRLVAGLLGEGKDEILRGEVRTDNNQPLQQQIAYMAQTDLLLPWLSVLDNVLIGSRLRNEYSASLKQEAEALLASMGLGDVLQKRPALLSGGMRQRVALARTFLENRPVVLMDEPFSALDTITRLRLQTLAAGLLKNRTVLFVTHDPLEALRLADDIYIMAGLPATLHMFMQSTGVAPRDPTSPEILQLHGELLKELTLKA